MATDETFTIHGGLYVDPIKHPSGDLELAIYASYDYEELHVPATSAAYPQALRLQDGDRIRAVVSRRRGLLMVESLEVTYAAGLPAGL